jgi:hypothetical protein
MKIPTFLPSVVCVLAVIGCGAAPASRAAQDSVASQNSTSTSTPLSQSIASNHDWTTFGWGVGRSSASTDPTAITAANVATMRRQQVTLDGTVDASAIYLHGVQVKGAAHDVFFVTTTYGKTIAIDAANATILWEFTPGTYGSVSGSRQITTSTPVADPSRDFIYAASPDGHIQKLAVADGHSVWSTAITSLPTREKIASPLMHRPIRGTSPFSTPQVDDCSTYGIRSAAIVTL